MRVLISIFVFIFFILGCFAQAPESPAVQKRKLDSLYAVFEKKPEHSSKTNDTIKFNTLFDLLKRVQGDTLDYFINYGLKLCNTYSSEVVLSESIDVTKLHSALKNDPFLYYYLRSKARLLIYLGGNGGSNDVKINYFLSALKIHERINNKLGMAAAYSAICYVYYQQSVFNKATENMLIALEIYEELGLKDKVANSYRIIGDVYQMQKLLNKALENYKNALDISKTLKDDFNCSACYESIGNCYIDMRDYTKAIDNHFASLKISEKLGDVKGVGDSYGDISSIYYFMKDYKKSLINSIEALNKYKIFSEPGLIANGYYDVAKVNYKLNKQDIALKYMDSALVSYQKLDDNYNTAKSYFFIGDIYIAKREYNKATIYMDKAVVLGKKNNYIELLRDVYNTMATLYVKQDDYKTAYKYHVLYSEMKDSLVNSIDLTTENIDALHSEFNKERKEQEKLVHEAILAQKEAKLEQEKTQRYALYGGLLLVITFSVFVFNRFRVTQKQKAIIEQQKQLVDDAFKTLEEKNKEVMDSITYAQRIQKALITSELYIEKQLNRLIKEDKTES